MLHIEPLHRGLVTSRDPSLLNEGELVFAQNVCYRPGSPSLHWAEGRQLLPDHSYDGVLPVFNVAWDNVPPMFIYLRPDNTLRYVPANQDPFADAMRDAASNAVLGEAAWINAVNLPEAVHFEGTHIVLDGSYPRQLTLTNALVPSMAFLGMPRNDTPVYVGVHSSGSAVPYGWHHYWFTWYSADREGTASVDAVGRILVAPATKLVVLAQASAFDSAKPLWATHIRIYRAAAQGNELPSPWPAGVRVAEVAIASLTKKKGSVLQAEYVRFNPTLDQNDDYYQLLVDLFTQTTTPRFETAAFTVDGTTVEIGRNSNPPVATTGDVFEESLLVNDVNDKRKARYSLAGEPSKFPDLYYINFETRDRDEIVAIRTLGRAAGVFLTNSVWRVNWLPRSGDDDFGRGRVTELLVDGLGVVGPNLVTSFQMADGPMLAWYSKRGPCATNLNEWIELAPQVDWNVPGAPVALLNNIAQSRLELYFTQADGSGLVYYLHYHASQVSDGKLAVTVLTRSNLRGAISAFVGDAQQLVSLDEQGNMYYEGIGVGDAAAVRTREIYLNGAGNEFRVTKVLTHGVTPANTTTWELYTGLTTKEGYVNADKRLALSATDANAEYVQLGLNNNASGQFDINWMGVEWESLGGVER